MATKKTAAKKKRTSKRERELIARVAELTRRLDDVNFIARQAALLEAQKDAEYQRTIATAKAAEAAAAAGSGRAFALLAKLVESMPKRADVGEED